MLEQANVGSGIIKPMRMNCLLHRAGVILVILFCAAPAQSATVDEVVKSVRSLAPAQRKAVLEEGARKEGEVNWYTSMSLTDFPKIVGAFEKATPVVKIRTNRLVQSSVMPKIETEARAGLFAVDVVASAPVEMWELKQKNFSTGYLSPELKGFTNGGYDPQGYWWCIEVSPVCLDFYTTMVGKHEWGERHS